MECKESGHALMWSQMAQPAKRQHYMSPPDIKLAYKRLHEVLKAGHFARPQADTPTLRHLNNMCTSFEPPQLGPCVLVPPLITTAAVSLISLFVGNLFGLTAKQILPTESEKVSNLKCTKAAGKIFLVFLCHSCTNTHTWSTCVWQLSTYFGK